MEGNKILSRNLLTVALLLLIIASGIVVFLLTQKKEPKVSLTKDYSNPFDTKTQYTNPFSDYKNPFDSLIK